MSRIRAKDTAPELLLRRALREAGIKFKKYAVTPVGRPDMVVFAGVHKLAVFIDGCFWHGCTEHYVPPRSRIEFWAKKLLDNVTRDERQTNELEKLGWRVVRVWEHEVIEQIEKVVTKVRRSLAATRPRRARAWRVFKVEWLDTERVLERRWLRDLRRPDALRSVERERQTKKARSPRRK